MTVTDSENVTLDRMKKKRLINKYAKRTKMYKLINLNDYVSPLDSPRRDNTIMNEAYGVTHWLPVTFWTDFKVRFVINETPLHL